jgi:hypothetical protein
MSNQGIVAIHGKNYKTVALRISEMRADHPDWGVEIDIIQSDDVVVIKAIIKNESGQIIGTGHAEEVRGSTNINKTSALENCETSAIGRALSSCGYGGEEYASANEVSDAIIKQEVMKEHEKMRKHMAAVLNCYESIKAIKTGIAAGRDSYEYKMAAEAWFELETDDKEALWRAPTKGGVFTTAEREEIRTTEFRVAFYGEDN